jgi:hypothetical protein
MPRIKATCQTWRDRHGAGHEDWTFRCPGCKTEHIIVSRAGANCSHKVEWGFNGDVDRPTFSPSLLVRWEYRNGNPTQICHSFIRNGQIQFLGDCTHSLAGQTVDLHEVQEC